jgi:23S rRNA (pseudouridine1915-N3)-methyltransferase
MKITILAVGRMKDGPERALVSRYLDRTAKAGRPLALEIGRVVEIAESRASDAAQRQREEAEALRRHLPDGAALIVLDERGKTLDSAEFASQLAAQRDNGRRDLVFVIGGADGIDETLRSEADMAIALGRMTWPHQIVRILLAEQIYRAATILAGHPYHRA